MAHNPSYYQQPQHPIQQPQQQYGQVYAQPQNIYQQLGQPQPQPHLQRHSTYSASPQPNIHPQQQMRRQTMQPQSYQYAQPQQIYGQPQPPQMNTSPSRQATTPYPPYQQAPQQTYAAPSQQAYQYSQPQQPLPQIIRVPSTSNDPRGSLSDARNSVLHAPRNPSFPLRTSPGPPISLSASLAQQVKSQVPTQPQSKPPIQRQSQLQGLPQSQQPIGQNSQSPPKAPGRRPLPQPAPGAKTPALPPSLQGVRQFSQINTNVTPQVESSGSSSPTRRPLPMPSNGNRASSDLGQLQGFNLHKLPDGGGQSSSNLAKSSPNLPSAPAQGDNTGFNSNQLGLRRTPSPAKPTFPAHATTLSRTLTQATESTSPAKRRASPPRFQPESTSPIKTETKTTWNSTANGPSSSSSSMRPMPQTSSNDTNVNASANTNAASETASPPKKFVPIWKRTIPDYPVPVFGYAAGMVSDPHPVVKPAAQAPSQTPAQTSARTYPVPSTPNASAAQTPNKRHRRGHSRTAASYNRRDETEEESEETDEDEEEDEAESDSESTLDDSEEENEDAYGGYERTRPVRGSKYKVRGGVKERRQYREPPGQGRRGGRTNDREEEKERRRERSVRGDTDRGRDSTSGRRKMTENERVREPEWDERIDRTRIYSRPTHSSELDHGVDQYRGPRNPPESEEEIERRYAPDRYTRERNLPQRREPEYSEYSPPRISPRRQANYSPERIFPRRDFEHSPERISPRKGGNYAPDHRPVLQGPIKAKYQPKASYSPTYGIRDLPHRAGRYREDQEDDDDAPEEWNDYQGRYPQSRNVRTSPPKTQSRMGISTFGPPQPPPMVREFGNVRRRTEQLRDREQEEENLERLNSRFGSFNVEGRSRSGERDTRERRSRSTGGGWPADLPRLPRTPGGTTSRAGGYFDLDSPGSRSGMPNSERRHPIDLNYDDPPPRSVSPALAARPQSQMYMSPRKVDDYEAPDRRRFVGGHEGKRPQSEIYTRPTHGQKVDSRWRPEFDPNKSYTPSQLHQQTFVPQVVQHEPSQHTQHYQQPYSPHKSTRDLYNNSQVNSPQAPAINIESPAPVGGRDKKADLQKMESERGDSDEEVLPRNLNKGKGRMIDRGPIQDTAPPKTSPNKSGINVGSPRAHHNSPSSNMNTPSINIEPPSININSPPRGPVVNVEPPRINIQDSQRDSPPRIQVYEVPGISVAGPEYGNGPPDINFTASEGEHSRPNPHRHQQPLQAQYSQPSPAGRGALICGGCRGPIIGRIVSAMGSRWHPGCFRCTVCDDLLEHVSSYEHDGRPYCHLDYHENFAPRCFSCKTSIVEERFISLDDPALGKRAYHEQHFFCAECGDPFLSPSSTFSGNGELTLSGDGEFEGFTVYKGHPYCEACHVRLRLPKCKRCKRSIRDSDEAVEALGGKWCWSCFTCANCEKPFEDPSFFQRGDQPYCERCFSIMLRNEI